MQGSLSEFRLAEILQLVAVQQKTGLLRLTRGQQLVTFYFDHGLLVATRDRRHVSFDPLLDYLGRVGWLQSEMAGLLRSKMESSREDLADILLGERFMTESELGGALDDLAQELVHQTFTWREGSYQFIGGDEALTGLRYKVALKIDTVLMEAARRADEWPRLLERLPGPDVVLDLVHAPSTSTEQRAYGVLSQITGVMRLGDVVRAGRVPEFEVYEILAQAVDAGLVRIVEKPAVEAEATETDTAEPGHESPRRRRTQTTKGTLWSVARPFGWGLALGISLLSAAGAFLVAPQLTSPVARERIHELEAAQARERIRMQIEVYRAVSGHLPNTLTDLVYADLASPALLARAEPLRYVLDPSGRNFTLAGPEPEPQPER